LLFLLCIHLYEYLAIGFYEIIQIVTKDILRKWIPAAAVLLFSVPGLYMSFINKEKLQKHPWRQMAEWLQQQPDFTTAAIYNPPASYKNFLLLDFYLGRSFPSRSIYDLKIGSDKKMYLVESGSVWQIKNEMLEQVLLQYDITKIPFQQGHPSFGNIYVCTKKE
jgi:hypothetical protein